MRHSEIYGAMIFSIFFLFHFNIKYFRCICKRWTLYKYTLAQYIVQSVLYVWQRLALAQMIFLRCLSMCLCRSKWMKQFSTYILIQYYLALSFSCILLQNILSLYLLFYSIHAIAERERENSLYLLKWIFDSCYSHQISVQNSKGLHINRKWLHISICIFIHIFILFINHITPHHTTHCKWWFDMCSKFPIPIGNNRFYRKWFEEPSTRSIFTRHSENIECKLIDLPFSTSLARSFSPFMFRSVHHRQSTHWYCAS